MRFQKKKINKIKILPAHVAKFNIYCTKLWWNRVSLKNSFLPYWDLQKQFGKSAIWHPVHLETDPWSWLMARQELSTIKPQRADACRLLLINFAPDILPLDTKQLFLHLLCAKKKNIYITHSQTKITLKTFCITHCPPGLPIDLSI